jgi:hypothetical protein
MPPRKALPLHLSTNKDRPADTVLPCRHASPGCIMTKSGIRVLGTNPVRKVTAGCFRGVNRKLASYRHSKPRTNGWRIRNFLLLPGGWMGWEGIDGVEVTRQLQLAGPTAQLICRLAVFGLGTSGRRRLWRATGGIAPHDNITHFTWPVPRRLFCDAQQRKAITWKPK